MNANFFDGLGRMFVGQATILFLMYMGWFPTTNLGINAIIAVIMSLTCMMIAVSIGGYDGRNN